MIVDTTMYIIKLSLIVMIMLLLQDIARTQLDLIGTVQLSMIVLGVS
jgi:hypothetical protein